MAVKKTKKKATQPKVEKKQFKGVAKNKVVKNKKKPEKRVLDVGTSRAIQSLYQKILGGARARLKKVKYRNI